MSTSAVLGPGSAMYKALDKLGVVPPQCKSFTITCAPAQPVIVNFECYMSPEEDQVVASVIAEQKDN